MYKFYLFLFCFLSCKTDKSGIGEMRNYEKRYHTEYINLINNEQYTKAESLVNQSKSSNSYRDASLIYINIIKKIPIDYSKVVQLNDDLLFNEIVQLRYFIEYEYYSLALEKVSEIESKLNYTSDIDVFKLEFNALKNLLAYNLEKPDLIDFNYCLRIIKANSRQYLDYYKLKYLVGLSRCLRMQGDDIGALIYASYGVFISAHEMNINSYPKLRFQLYETLGLLSYVIEAYDASQFYLNNCTEIAAQNGSEYFDLIKVDLLKLMSKLNRLESREDKVGIVRSFERKLSTLKPSKDLYYIYLIISGLYIDLGLNTFANECLDSVSYFYSNQGCSMNKSYYYRLQSKLNYYQGNYNVALTQLDSSIVSISCIPDTASFVFKSIINSELADVFLKMGVEKKDINYCKKADSIFRHELFLSDQYLDQNSTYHLSSMAHYTTSQSLKALYELSRLDSLFISNYLELALNQIQKSKNRNYKYSYFKNQILSEGSHDIELNKCLLKLNTFENAIEFDKDVEKIFHVYNDVKLSFHDKTTNESSWIKPNLDLEVFKSKLQDHSCQWIEYFVGEDYIYTIIISPKVHKFYKSRIDSIEDYVKNYLISLRNNNEVFEPKENYILVEKLGLTQLDTQYQNVIISTDNFLSSVPFEAFSLDSFDSYLIEAFNISYNKSAFAMLGYDVKKIKCDEISFFSYTDQNTLKNNYKSNYPELEFSAKELEHLETTFIDVTQNIYQGCDLSFKNFTNFNSSKIVHLSTHSFSHPDSLNGNYIVFRNSDGTINLVNSIELDTFKYDGKLYFLSSCETNIGKYRKGEGVFSLSNTFLKNGASSVVSSLWKVNEQSTEELVRLFYKDISQGHNLNYSLRNAKVNIINNHYAPQFTHPYYWAPFVLEGNPFIKFNLD